MSKLNIKKIINEEIKNFDFLGNEEFLKGQEDIELLSNEDLQKQFICDSLLKRKSKIKILQIKDATLGGNWDENDFKNANLLTIDYNLHIEYLYDTTKHPLNFDLYFYSDNVGIKVNGNKDIGDYYTAPYSESWFNYIMWDDINVSLHTDDGDDINFNALKNAPHNIQVLFIREYTESFITNKTSMNINNNIDKSSIAQYC